MKGRKFVSGRMEEENLGIGWSEEWWGEGVVSSWSVFDIYVAVRILLLENDTMTSMRLLDLLFRSAAAPSQNAVSPISANRRLIPLRQNLRVSCLSLTY